jgi:hypothetical protein
VTGPRLAWAVAAAVQRRAEDAALGALDAVLASRVATEAVDRILASELVERAVGKALEGPLVEAAARDLARFAVLERLADRLLADPGMERLLARVLESTLLDEAVHRLLDGDELWLVVDEVAQSPSVTDAIARQSVGFADQVAGGVRDRTRSADAWLERVARRALRRSAPG